MNPTKLLPAALAAALAALAAPAAEAAPFDKVLLKDGRLIEGKLLDSDDPAYIRLQLSGVEIPIRNELVDKTFVEDLENYVPKNKQEEEYLAKGWVLFEGRWMARTRRETELRKRKAKEDKAIEQARKEQRWSNAKQESRRRFEVTSNAPQDVMDDYVERLEDYYKNFLDHWNIKLSPSVLKKKQKFFLYRNAEDFQKITESRPGVLGFFNWVKGELHLFHSTMEPEFTISVLYHEGNHLLTHLIDPNFRYPTWMNEGMAEYYGSAVVDEDGDFIVGGLQYGRIATLRTDQAKDDFRRLRDILMLEQADYGGREYAYGWSFVHFLMEHPKYATPFRKFFGGLPENKDIEVQNQSGATVIAGKEYSIVIANPDLASVAAALEKRLGKSVEELEEEWLEYIAQAYGDLTAPAYYDAARLSRFNGGGSEESLIQALEYYEKAVGLQSENPNCYREFAEFLRHGGTSDVQIANPDLPRAWAMIQKAMELDPINPFNYTEAAGILMENSEVQDLDMALAMTETARALGPGRWDVKLLTDLLVAQIEPARERRRMAAEEKERRAEIDERVWIVQPAYIDGEEVPEQIPDLSTDDLRELIAAGVVAADDWVFQTFRYADPDTGELLDPEEKWDKEWTALKEVPDFAEDLEAAGG